MDQGLAAVLGAGVAVIGTLGTAGLTFRAARCQARDQSRADHRQKLRDERRDAYGAFMETTEPLDRAIFDLVDTECIIDNYQSPSALRASEEALADIDVAVHDLYRARMRVRLIGPGSVSAWADELWNDAAYLKTVLTDFVTGRINMADFQEAVDKVEISKRRFAESANAVLEALP
ncbi:hypothetical protein [Streptomyces sp. NPDC001100]